MKSLTDAPIKRYIENHLAKRRSYLRRGGKLSDAATLLNDGDPSAEEDGEGESEW